MRLARDRRAAVVGQLPIARLGPGRPALAPAPSALRAYVGEKSRRAWGIALGVVGCKPECLQFLKITIRIDWTVMKA